MNACAFALSDDSTHVFGAAARGRVLTRSVLHIGTSKQQQQTQQPHYWPLLPAWPPVHALGVSRDGRTLVAMLLHDDQALFHCCRRERRTRAFWHTMHANTRGGTFVLDVRSDGRVYLAVVKDGLPPRILLSFNAHARLPDTIGSEEPDGMPSAAHKSGGIGVDDDSGTPVRRT
jgi:hypothetical protein